MVNKPLIRPYFWGGVALGGVARIPMMNPGGVFFKENSHMIEATSILTTYIDIKNTCYSINQMRSSSY